MTYQIIYSSEASTPMQADDLEDLLKCARSKNAIRGITGALVYADGVFLQILEGDRVHVDDLMAKIVRDLRHETITVFREGEIASAVFTGWEMAYVSATAAQVAKWAGLSGASDIPDVVCDMRQDPQRAALVAQSIRSYLAPSSSAQASAR